MKPDAALMKTWCLFTMPCVVRWDVFTIIFNLIIPAFHENFIQTSFPSRAPHIHISRTCSLSRYLPRFFFPTEIATPRTSQAEWKWLPRLPTGPKGRTWGLVNPDVSWRKKDGKKLWVQHWALLMILWYYGFWWKKQKQNCFFLMSL